MRAFLEIAMSNAVHGAVLAIIVFFVTRAWRNANVARFLWALVLVKLIVPPAAYLSVPVFWPSRSEVPKQVEKQVEKEENEANDERMVTVAATLFSDVATDGSLGRWPC